MELSQNLRELLARQQEQGKQLEAAIAELEAADFLRENAALAEQVARGRDEAALMARQVQTLTAENNSMRERLMEQMYQQRGALLSGARRQTDILFGQEEQTAVNRLAATNTQARARLSALRAQLEGYEGPAARELLDQVAGVENAARAFMRDSSGRLSEGFAAARADVDGGYDALDARPLTPDQVNQKLQHNSLELRVGGKVTVVVGVFFILLAVIFGLRYSYLYLLKSDILKGIVAYSLGLVFLGAAEFMGRKQRTVFSTGICAGGIAILFASTAVSYFSLGILSIPMAVGICVLVTGLALLQSMRYNAQVIAVFALLGGYLPMTAVENTPVMIISAMGYFLLLNLFVLLVAVRKRWQPIKFLSIVANFSGAWFLLFFLSPQSLAAGILYVAANFLLYMAIVLVYPILKRTVLRKSDTVLLALNTFFSSAMIFALLDTLYHRDYYAGMNGIMGAVSLGFCLVYFVFAKWVKTVLEEDAGVRGLFYTTSFAFWALTIPLLLEPRLISLGWLFQGVALCVYGILTSRSWYRRAGGVIAALCLGSFLLGDIPRQFTLNDYDSVLFSWNFAAITLGAIVILTAYLYRFREQPAFWQSAEGRGVNVYKVCTLIWTWLCALYLCYDWAAYRSYAWTWLFTAGLFALVTVGLGALYRAIEPIRDRAVMAVSRILSVLGFVFTLYLGLVEIPTVNDTLWVVALITVLAFLAGTGLALYDMLRRLSRENKLSPEWVTMFTSIYALLLAVEVLMVQGDLSFRSMIISFLFIAWALFAILFGFVRRYAYLRRFGLVLSLLAISKLFLLDLYFLQSGQRILSYFVFGVIFIAISYVYQLFSKRLFPVEVAAMAEPPDRNGPSDPSLGDDFAQQPAPLENDDDSPQY